MLPYKFLHFPRTESKVYGDLISKFLRGELGDIKNVNPYLVALLYAGDRENAKHTINQWLQKGYYVIVDRYVYSNIAFQTAKFKDEKEKQELREWILHAEYQYFNIPKPDINIFLNVPFEFIRKNLSNIRQGDDRNYLKGKKDIHEASLDFQKNVLKEYLLLEKNDPDFHRIDCFHDQNSIFPAGDIFKHMINILKSNSVI